MFTSMMTISVVIAILAIETDKLTRFTHPSLQWIAYAGMLGVMLSLI